MTDIFGWDPSNPTDFSNFDWGSAGAGAAGAYDAYTNGGQDQVIKPWMAQGTEQGLATAVDAAQQQFAQGPQSYYPGQTIASQDPNITAGQNSQLANIDRLQGMADQSGGAASYLQSGGDKVGGFTLEDQIGFGIPEQYQNAIMDPIMRNLNEQVIPGIHTAAQSQGAFGGSRMQQQKSDAATQATTAATDQMIQGNLQARGQSIGQRAGDISAQLSGRGQDIQQLGQQASNMYNGINAAGTAMGQQQIPGQMQSDIGAQRQAYDQSLLNADINRFDWNRQEGNLNIDRLFNRMQGAAGMGGQIQQGQDTGYLDALAGFGAGSNIWNSVFGQSTPQAGGSFTDNTNTSDIYSGNF
jgi:hypothetical protein